MIHHDRYDDKTFIRNLGHVLACLKLPLNALNALAQVIQGYLRKFEAALNLLKSPWMTWAKAFKAFKTGCLLENTLECLEWLDPSHSRETSSISRHLKTYFRTSQTWYFFQAFSRMSKAWQGLPLNNPWVSLAEHTNYYYKIHYLLVYLISIYYLFCIIKNSLVWGRMHSRTVGTRIWSEGGEMVDGGGVVGED